MSIAYQYTADGFFIGQCEDYGFPPHNSTHIKPAIKAGYVPQWNGKRWQQVEDHKGETGFLKGEAFTIKDFGPYPEGWSTEPPALTKEDLFELLRSMRDSKLSACDWTVLPDSPLSSKKISAWKEYRQLLRDLPALEGAPWDGGGEQTPWPVLPD